jgi:hypothetical protein
MGHDWREMDPAGARDADRLLDLEQELLAKVKNIPLTNLTLGDISDFVVVLINTRKYGFCDEYAKVFRRLIEKGT